VLLAVRGALAALHSIPTQGLLRTDGVQSLTFMAAFVVVILASLGFILMAKDRADANNHYFATRDALTGLFNRRALLLAARRDVAVAARSHEPYALMMVDIDHFKAVNDGHGHQVGDQILCHVAGLLSARLRAQDMVGRYGGEEFLVLLPNTAQQAAAELAETLRSAVAQCPCAREGCAITATVSIGVCGGQLHGTEDWERLLRCADQALYAAKAAGRNRVVSGRFVPEAAQPLATPVI
jgi:diguanylate cyclase (GGDEF)-like protein